MSRELLQQALDVIKSEYSTGGTNKYSPYEVMEALEQELAKPEQKVLGSGLCLHPSVLDYLDKKKVRTRLDYQPYTGAGEASKIKHSLEPQPEQVPVAKHVCNLWINPKTSEYEVDRCTHPINEVIPVYTAPPSKEWIGLTNDELWDAYDKGLGEDEMFARAIEAKLKEKNGGS